MGYGLRAPFIWGLAMALGSMKLEGSYIPFWGDWKSIGGGHHGAVREEGKARWCRARSKGGGKGYAGMCIRST